MHYGTKCEGKRGFNVAPIQATLLRTAWVLLVVFVHAFCLNTNIDYGSSIEISRQIKEDL